MPRIPIDLSSGRIKEENLIVGIDLGTTNSLIARVLDGQPECIADHGKDVMVPSVIRFVGTTPEVGETAAEYLATDPEHTLYSVKRLLGKSYRDLAEHQAYFAYEIIDPAQGAFNSETDAQVRVKIGNRFYTPVELSSVILAELKRRAEHRLKVPIERAVITVPAYFNDAQRQATRDAGKLAGLDVLRIVNEPTAAALAYGLGLRADEHVNVAVFDLGGGTFDVTIMRIEAGIFEVLSTHGDTFLGGDDFDRAIVHHWLGQLGIGPETLTHNRPLNQRIRLLAKQAKTELSAADHFRGELSVGETIHSLVLSRVEFEALIAPLVERTIQSCLFALREAQLRTTDLHDVLLVGGSTRVPLVRQRVQEVFGRVPNTSLNPDEVVALGAAVQADILAGNRKDMLLLDVTPLSLGIETLGGLMDVLIPRNNKVPARASRQYTTSRDGQVNLRVSVYQGEREQVQHNRLLAEFELRGIPAMPAGLPKVEITFLVDADGILRVSATELRSGVAQEISVKPSSGLTDDEVETRLLDSLTHAQQDVAERLVLEAIQEGQQLVYSARNFLVKHGSFFSADEIAQTEALVGHLSHVVETRDKDSILAAIEELDAHSKPLAERVMNAAVGEALRGRTV